MDAAVALFMYAGIIAVIFVVAYFVIKKAIKDALREYKIENGEGSNEKQSEYSAK